MASSRWKRFAFFEKQSLNLPSQVLSDLLPKRSDTSPAALRSSNVEGRTEHAVSLVVSTASLPLKSKPAELGNAPASGQNAPLSNNDDADALTQMWSSLNACGELSSTLPSGQDSQTVVLPSQSQSLNEAEEVVPSPEEALDGLVLVFTASQSSKFVHCFDVTVRCNPPDASETNLEDLDGWRGYFAPFDDDTVQGIIAIASCRSTEGHRPLNLACIANNQICIWEDPHLILSCRTPLISPSNVPPAKKYRLDWNASKDGRPTVVDLVPGIVAVGTDTGVVLLCIYGRQGIKKYLRIPSPPAPGMSVVSVKIGESERNMTVFVAYRRSQDSQTGSSAGICCYDVPIPGPNTTSLSAPSARHDLDGRQVSSPSLCDAVSTPEGFFFTVARSDGLYTYSQTQKIGVAPIDGLKLSMCMVPPPILKSSVLNFSNGNAGSNYALVASTDNKSDRDSIDLYDPFNKLVAFHLLLSPGHRAVKCAGVTTPVGRSADGSLRGSRSSAVVLTSGGALISFTEKVTEEKVSLLVQKNLFSAAVQVAYSDPSLEPSSITALYRKYAEHLYRKGDYAGSIDQYINTIGSLESSHVIFRFLDAPKIPLLAKYLEELRARDLVTPVHLELLRTCYLKLNEMQKAEAITTATSASSLDKDSIQSLSSSLASNPRDALATICSLEAPQAAEMLVAHGASLARSLPRETAGVVVALCVGTYSPKALADAVTEAAAEANKMLEPRILEEREKICDQYPLRLFYSAFIDNPKMLRLILAHCNRNKCHLTPSLRRTLLELTLEEWNQAKRSGDTELEKIRQREATAALTDSHCHEIGDHDALFIVQTANFDEGELLLYERLQMNSMLLSRYGAEGSDKSRRQMLAMTQADPEVLADVLGHFVSIGSSQLYERKQNEAQDDDSEDGAQILDEIHEALAIARLQGQVTPVRIARVLAGEGTEQFSGELSASRGGLDSSGHQTVPLSVALEYVGSILDESRKEISRLKSEVQEYNQLCNSMESEVLALMNESNPSGSFGPALDSSRLDIDGVYSKVRPAITSMDRNEDRANSTRETFWRELSQSEDNFETVARFFAKGVIQ